MMTGGVCSEQTKVAALAKSHHVRFCGLFFAVGLLVARRGWTRISDDREGVWCILSRGAGSIPAITITKFETSKLVSSPAATNKLIEKKQKRGMGNHDKHTNCCRLQLSHNKGIMMYGKLIKMARAAGFEVSHTLSGADEYNTADDLERFVEIIRESERQSQWQPIESAPLNKSVLVRLPYGNYFVGFQQAGWHDSFGRELRGIRPTHWQPLPKPLKENLR